jgi:SAM-dependent methyltransferase
VKSGPLFAALYDPLLWPLERLALGSLRRSLVSRAEGKVLEVGAGTGANLPYYGPRVRELVLSEPDPDMAARLRARLAASGRTARVLEAPVEAAGGGPFDAVVCALVLCSVEDPAAACAALRALLRPGGRLLFLEHVRHAGPAQALQDALSPVWSRAAGGCRLGRATAARLREAGFEVRVTDGLVLPLFPLVAGEAVRI